MLIYKYLSLIISVFCSISLYSQVSEGGIPTSFSIQGLSTIIPTSTVSSQQPPIDTPIIVTEYVYDSILNTVEVDSFTEDGSQTVGLNISKVIFLKTQSNVLSLPEGKLYRIRVTATNAKGIGFIFSNFSLPNGAKMYVYSPDSLFVLGAFTNINNNADNKLVTSILPYPSAIIEVFYPTGSDMLLSFKVTEVIYYFINDFFITPIPSSRVGAISSIDESCYGNVYCRTNYYGGIERSVMKWEYSKGNTRKVCSCALINQNVSGNEVKPYVLTANHCGDGADLSTATFYFNYQYSRCLSSYLSPGFTTTGATKKTSKSSTDMFLLELNNIPPADYNVFYAGWDHRDYPHGSGKLMLGIHHPKGVNKKYSEGWLQSNVLIDKWRVKWNRNSDRFTDNGSSGSPLFEDVNGRIIGQLSTGPIKTGCDKLKSRFIWRYGKIYRSWGNLEPYLDPTFSQTQLNGRIPCYNNLTLQNRNFPNASDYQPDNFVKIQCSVDMLFSPKIFGTIFYPNRFNYGANYLFTAGNSITIDAGGIDIPLGCTVEFNIGACTEY